MWEGPQLGNHHSSPKCQREERTKMLERLQKSSPVHQVLIHEPPAGYSPRHQPQQRYDEITVEEEEELILTSSHPVRWTTASGRAVRKGIETHLSQYNLQNSPHLHFPPPPDYPPPQSRQKPRKYDVNESREANLAMAAAAAGHSFFNEACGITFPEEEEQFQRLSHANEYSYAYYEPGPIKRHSNVPPRYPGGGISRPLDAPGPSGLNSSSVTYKGGSYNTRHTYLTRYGTEENIYEEIGEAERARLMQLQALPNQLYDGFEMEDDEIRRRNRESLLSINQSIVEEEVRRVQTGHRRVLGELNLSVEAMLMPSTSSSSREGSEGSAPPGDKEIEDQLADLLTVGPTDELLSPVPQTVDLDSGFSGSSSGASYRSAGGSLRRGGDHDSRRSCPGGYKCSTSASAGNVSALLSKSKIERQNGDSVAQSVSNGGSGGKSFWSKKGWKKLGFSGSSTNLSRFKGKILIFV